MIPRGTVPVETTDLPGDTRGAVDPRRSAAEDAVDHYSPAEADAIRAVLEALAATNRGERA